MTAPETRYLIGFIYAVIGTEVAATCIPEAGIARAAAFLTTGLWVVAGAGLAVLFVIARRRRRHLNQQQETSQS